MTKPYNDEEGHICPERKRALTKREIHKVSPIQSGGTDETLEQLIASGHPMGIICEQLVEIDIKLKIIVEQNRYIIESLQNFRDFLVKLQDEHLEIGLHKACRDIFIYLVIICISGLFMLSGISIIIFTSETAMEFISKNGSIIGLIMMAVGLAGSAIICRRLLKYWSNSEKQTARKD